MKPNYSISIPAPCHEEWSKMTPNEKGRFCQSCSKTVVDFTKMNVNEIQDYIQLNKDKRICGHIKQSQLNSINLKVPESIFNQHLNFHRLFLLALLLTMGMTLLSCEDEKGKTKKIESVEIIKSHKKSIDSIFKCEGIKETHQDSINKKGVKASKGKITEQQILDGMMVIETGDIEVIPNDIDKEELIDIDSLEIEIPEIVGEIIVPPQEEFVSGLLVFENPPEFEDTPKDLSRSEKKKHLSNRVTEIVQDNFNLKIAESLNLKGKQRIYTQFKINENGAVEDIKVRSSTHSALKAEAIRVIKLLPLFKPGNQRGKNIATIYTLPIVFIIED
ncbi:energy transducer TonB [Winogradskyella echinorum]|uniref:Energy transducer TonB n=1 Tax=Winogradskyella echinorum TaxID=538189 RepID=A0ABR6Y007_9FLAO|nr:energy transducer TonB [Winogradskyella echinorum]MBC3846045.1 energy transducer TonB [Winogradskyella echinorum]MBC5750393.1 energy transducer TonB [Winogradskyella echinorum]